MRLFEPVRIGSLELPNRIAKSAMAEGRCDAAGYPRPSLVRLYERWAAGGVGLAITGMAHIRRGYGFTGHELGLYEDAQVPALRPLTDAVHRHPGKIFVQLCFAPPQIPRAAARRLGSLAPSAGFNRTNLLWDRALTVAELGGIVADFGHAARRARAAGFDGLQLHGAHGYLIARMLSPKHNRRRDAYGGDGAGRLRFLREVYAAIRREVGRDYPVTIKLNLHDGEPGGLELDEGVAIGKELAAWGFDAIEASAGTGDVGLGFYPNRGGVPEAASKRFLYQNFPWLRLVGPLVGPILRRNAAAVALREEAYFAPLARALGAAVPIPVLCVGGIRSREVAEALVADGRVAMVSLARPLVREPDLPQRWQRGAGTTAACESCNECFVHIGLGKPLVCHRLVQEPAPC